MTLATWFTPRRRRAETSRRTSVMPPLAASEPVKVPEPRRSPEDAAESWAHGRAAVDGELVVWRTWAGEDA